MPLAPELKTMPEITYKFFRSGLATEIISDMIAGDRKRSFAQDAERLLQIYGPDKNFNIEGFENINGGCLLAINHPNMDVLFPAALALFQKVFKERGKNVKVAMASEILLTTKFNDKRAVPGSIALMRRFHHVYENSIISTPTVMTRKDFVNGRAVAARKILETLRSGDIVLIAPEGHTEEKDVVSPINTFHEGSGTMARLAAKFNIPTVPASIYSYDRKNIDIKLGKPFYPDSPDDFMNVINIMRKVAQGLPVNLRGPFQNPNS